MGKRLALISLCAAVLLLCACGRLGTTHSVKAPETKHENTEDDKGMNVYDFSKYKNVTITGVDPAELNEAQFAVLDAQARYCQAMTDADINAMREMVSEDMVFTHMSGKQQTREEYFADVANGNLTYFSIGMENPEIDVSGDRAAITYTAVLNADAYGARGTFRMNGTHAYEKRNGRWIAVDR